MKYFALLFLLFPVAAHAVDWRATDRLKNDQGGVFFEPSPTASEEEIRASFRFACSWNKKSPEDLKMPQLVVPFVGYWDGQHAHLYERELKIAREYFSCFERIFLGTAHVALPDGREAARKFLLSGKLAHSHRAAAKEILFDLANLIDWRSAKYHWFVPVEARLEDLSPPEGPARGLGVQKGLGQAVGAVVEELRLRESIDGKGSLKRIMWAPSFGVKYGAWLDSKRPGGALARAEILGGVKAILKATPGITDITLLDGAADSSAFLCEKDFCYRFDTQPEPMNCEADTVPYYSLLLEATENSLVKRVGVGAELQYGKIKSSLNEKSWEPAPGYVPMPFAEVERTRRCLGRHKVPFGAAYELRYLYRSFSTPEEKLRYQFFDVPKGSAHFESVRTLVERGIAWPCKDEGNLFCAERSISRGDAAIYLLRAKQGAWADPKLAMAATGLCPGPAKKCAGQPITRGEFLTALFKIKGEKPVRNGRLSYRDVPTDSNLAGWLLRADALGLEVSCAGAADKFCPEQAITRGEMANLLKAAWGF